MKRAAQCACGRLKVEADVEPASVVACSCIACQRRSGSPFGMGAYWSKDQLRITGESQVFSRPGVSGKLLHNHFCPACGATVYWTIDRDPRRVGVAVGAFADPHFPAPQRTVFDGTKHDWVSFPEDTPGFIEGRDGPRSR